MKRTTTELVDFECDMCDGCGWYEGGPTLATTCHVCEGTGIVKKERHIRHKWIIGQWGKRSSYDRYYTREDECEHCSCKRGVVKTNKFGPLSSELIVYYNRSKQIFGHDHMPDCWGAKNPE